ncbi:RDD family protein [Falsibacillus pallidus]|uniref:Putative RDD family membrane protein YckC n=1 Tax=Falsibacillus pallidus TaxID=493781 RepID=A0A370GLX1_9BACI|nr:putative RDD family membrane protein YckC [Falsibacillus pallidus]
MSEFDHNRTDEETETLSIKDDPSSISEPKDQYLERAAIPEEAARSFATAGFWMRFWAYLLDLIVIGSIDRLLIKPVFRLLDFQLHDTSMFAPISILFAIVFYGYFVLMTKYFGATIGKMVFGLRVISVKRDRLTWGTVLFREWIGRYISATVAILYILVAFMPKKQGLHDVFADTTVIHERRLETESFSNL